MDSQTLQQRIRLGEDSTLELKQIVPHPDGLSDELAAFANANGGTSVPRSLWIHESANGYFRRVADGKRWLSAYELERAMIQRGLSWIHIRHNRMSIPSSFANDRAEPYV